MAEVPKGCREDSVRTVLVMDVHRAPGTWSPELRQTRARTPASPGDGPSHMPSPPPASAE